jgi:tRNA U34 5-methylaminomethyl-2-thiouridine-forming methyltransferase MnmC
MIETASLVLNKSLMSSERLGKQLLAAWQDNSETSGELLDASAGTCRKCLRVLSIFQSNSNLRTIQDRCTV